MSPNNKRHSIATHRTHGFTLIELLVVIGIIAVLIGILVPVLNRARRAAKTVACASNMRQLALAAITFANEHDGYLPNYSYNSGPIVTTAGNSLSDQDLGFRSPKWTWDYVLSQQIKNKNVFRCSSDDGSGVRGTSPDEIPDSYRMNAGDVGRGRLHSSVAASDSWRAVSLASLNSPVRAMLFLDGTGSSDPANPVPGHVATWEPISGTVTTAKVSFTFRDNVAWNRHNNSANYAFADGHVEAMGWEETWEVLDGSGSTKVTRWRQLYSSPLGNPNIDPIP